MSQTTVDSVDLLAEIYRNYITAEGLPPLSADEQDFNQLTEEQITWIEAFEILWDDAQSQ
tara:strand:- start:795 stop:974 length:180 start_codon:yes stop_codon:yes gene_type:complete